MARSGGNNNVLRCSFCGKTHALIPSLIVPYSQIPREDQQEILKLNEEGK